MLAKKILLVGICILLISSLAIADPPAVHPITGEELVIECLKGTPAAIDGDLSDWNLEAMTPAVLDVAEQLHSGQDSWTAPEDCSGEFYLLWDDENIYVAVVVKDDTLSMNKTGGDIWNADAVEIFFATTNAVAGHDEHYQYGFNANNQRWNWCNMDGAGGVEPDYLQIASTVTADGYICEASIPYAQMPSLDFSAGNTIGFHPVFDDTDNGDRELQMTWTGREAHDQSLGYGHMVLSDNPVSAGVTAILSGLSDVTVVDGVIESLRDAGTEYVVADSDLGLGTTTRWYVLLDVELLWAEGEPAPTATVSGTSNPKDGDVGSKADNFNFTLNGSTNISSIDGIDFQETIFPMLSDTFFVFERGGNDVGSFQAILADGSLGEPVEFVKASDGGPYADTGIDVNGQNAYGLVFKTSEPVQGVRITASGHDTLSISIPVKPVDPGSEDLVAFYALDNDVLDSSGNELHGTIVGDPTFVEGQIGMALELDGDDYVDCGSPPELVITDAISIACWVNPAQLGGEQGFAGLDGGYSFKAHGEGVRFTTPGILDHSSANLTLEASAWQHVAATFQPGQDEGLVFYLNGVETERMTSSAINEGSGPFRIGNNQWNELLTGLIDEVAVYSRILSAGEVMYLAGYREFTFEGDALDDTWDHDNGSDQWDGTGPGEGNPGGAALLVEDGVDFLRIQDTGDPRDLGISEPSNRKVYLTRLTDISLDGLHLEVCMRVATTPPLDDQISGEPWPAEGIGYHIRDNGKGMIGVSDGVGIISFSLGQAGEADYPDATTDLLVMNNLVGAEPSGDVDTGDAATAVNMLAIEDASQWNTFVIDIAAGGAGTHVVTVSANGGAAESFDVTVGSGTEAESPYITIGSSGTGGITAFDVDYLSVKQNPFAEEEVVNILANGGFEDGVPDPWSTYGDASLEVVQDDPAEGDYCLHVTVGSAGANFWDAGLQHAGHVFEAGKSYTLSAYLKAKEGTMNINFKPELAADPWTGYGSQEFTMTDTWAEYTVNTGVIPENVDPATITFHIAYTAGEFYVDDVRFTED